MANEIVLMDEPDDELNNQSDDDLLKGIRFGIDAAKVAIRKSAQCMRVLHKRGKDLDWILENGDWSAPEVAYLNGLRLVSHGFTLPEILLFYLTRPKVVDALSKLSLERQQRLLEGEGFPLREYKDGQPTERMITPALLSNKVLDQLFTPEGKVRSLAEQDVYLVGERNREAVRAKDPDIRVGKKGRWKVDRLKRGAWKNGEFYPESEFRAILRELDE